MPRHRLMLAIALAALALAAAVAGCGDDTSTGASASSEGGAPLTVYAASSLRDAFPAIEPDARYSFASSGTLKTQIERGAPADLFASASPEQARALARDGHCSPPVAFATNTLVLVVPRDDRSTVRSLDDLRAGGHRIAIGGTGVPVGDYTRTLLEQLGLSSVLRDNTVSEERDVASVTGKVALGSADAGFVYRTDARATADRTRVVPLPRQEPARYEICAVRDTPAARAFIDRVRSAAGQAALRRAGFGTP